MKIKKNGTTINLTEIDLKLLKTALAAKIKGVSQEQLEYNDEHGLPMDWQGSKEGYHEYITKKKFHSGSN
tara:strand:- start:939 stop:1148 length:210 start_codon:yes stop_codon:yes gene_type:complete